MAQTANQMHTPHRARIRSIIRKHRGIDRQVAAETNRPAPDTSVLQRLKREKLRLKDELARHGWDIAAAKPAPMQT